MRYSLVLATLAASAIATPYVNIDITESNDLEDTSRRHGSGRHHRSELEEERRRRQHHRGGGWFSSLWRSDEDLEDDDEDEMSRHRDRDYERRRNRNHRHGGRRERGREEEDEEDSDYNDDFSVNNLVDDLFGTDFECVIQAKSQQEEKHNARECCREIGGELYDEPGRCIFRDVFQNPRDEWRDCAMDTKGTDFADCYYREQREVDDSLSSRRRSQRDSQKQRDRSRNGKNRDSSRDSSRDRNQRVFDLDEDSRRGGRIVCQIEENQNDQQMKQIVRQCCQEDQVRGKLGSRERECLVQDNQEAQAFEQCAQEEGVQDQDIVCYNRRNRNEF